jgi:hypothetical protein
MTTGSQSARELPVLLGAGAGAPESLLLIGAPDAAGMVLVRRWTADDWSAMPSPRAERAETVLEWLDAQLAAGRPMNQSAYAVRLWLRGEGKAAP